MTIKTQANVRLALGLGQMAGAVLSGIVLFATGLSRMTVISFLATSFLTVLSLTLFPRRRVSP